MTTLFVADGFFPDTVGGAARVARELAEGLAAVDDVVIVSRNPDGSRPATEKQGGCEIHRFSVDTSKGTRFLGSAMTNATRLVRRLRLERRPQRVVIHQPMSGIAALPWIYDLPTIYHFHSPWAEEYRTQLSGPNPHNLRSRLGITLRHIAEDILLRNSRVVITLSDYMKSELHRLHRHHVGRTVIIPGGVDLQRFSPGNPEAARRRLGLAADAEILLSVRNLMPRMGLPALIDAFAELAQRRPKLRLLIGGSGPMRPRLEQQSRERHVSHRVHFIGRIPDAELPDLYRAADLFVLPTAALEGFGLVTLEALASGIPVVATPVGASPEILRKLDPLLLAANKSSTSLSASINAFLNRDMASKRAISERGRKLCEERYGWATVRQIFNELVLQA